MTTLAYILAIAAINYGFEHIPLLPTPWGDMWPPMSLAVGFVFVLRDFAQREVGHWVLLAMLAGGALSWWMASPFVAIASVAAFGISEIADWGVYTWTRRPLHERILWSSALGTPIDSAVFLLLIGHFSWSGVALMTASKMLGALVVSWLARHPAWICRVLPHGYETVAGPREMAGWGIWYGRCVRCGHRRNERGSLR